jgi:hypothetical protein
VARTLLLVLSDVSNGQSMGVFCTNLSHQMATLLPHLGGICAIRSVSACLWVGPQLNQSELQ